MEVYFAMVEMSASMRGERYSYPGHDEPRYDDYDWPHEDIDLPPVDGDEPAEEKDSPRFLDIHVLSGDEEPSRQYRPA